MADKQFIKETLKKIFERIVIKVDGVNILEIEIIKQHLVFLMENYDKGKSNTLLGFHTGNASFDFAQADDDSFYKARFPNGSDCYNVLTITYALFHNILCNYSEENQKQRTYEYIKECFDDDIRTFRFGPQLYTFTKVTPNELKARFGDNLVSIPNPDYNKLRPAFGSAYSDSLMNFLEKDIGLNLSYFPLNVESEVYLVMDHNRFNNYNSEYISITDINGKKITFENLAFKKVYNSRNRGDNTTEITSLVVSPHYDYTFVNRNTNSVLVLDEKKINKYQDSIGTDIERGEFKNLFLSADYSAINMVDFLRKYENISKFIPCKSRIEDYKYEIADEDSITNENVTVYDLIAWQINDIRVKEVEECQFVIRDSIEVFSELQKKLKQFGFNREQNNYDKDFQFIARNIIKTVRTSVCKPSELINMRAKEIVQTMVRETYTPSGMLYDSLDVAANIKKLNDCVEKINEQYRQLAKEIYELTSQMYLYLKEDDRKISYLLEKLDMEEKSYQQNNVTVKDNFLIVVETRAQKQIANYYISKYKDTLNIDVKLPNEVNFEKYYKTAYVMGLVNCWNKKFNIFTTNSIGKIIVYFYNFEKPNLEYYKKHAEYILSLWTKDYYWPKALNPSAEAPETSVGATNPPVPQMPDIPDIFTDGDDSGEEDHSDSSGNMSPNVEWYLKFTDGSYAFISSNYKAWILRNNSDGTYRVETKRIADIEPEDIVLFKNNNVNFIDNIIQNLVENNVLNPFMNMAYEKSKEWKQKLRDFKENNPFIWSDNIAAQRIGRGIATILSWLSDDNETMAPGNNIQEIESAIRNIGNYINDAEMQNYAADYAKTCLAFQDWHERTLKSTLKAVIISQITEKEKTNFDDDNDRRIYSSMLENMKKTTVACEVSEIRKVNMRVKVDLLNKYISR